MLKKLMALLKTKDEPIKEPVNPDGLTRSEFIKRYRKYSHIAEICWHFGVYPEELVKEFDELYKDAPELIKKKE